MKKTILIWSIIFLAGLPPVIGQSTGINFQAVARDNQGVTLSNMALTIWLSIVSGNENGTVEWKEVQNLTTNAMGQFTLIIGKGQYVSGTISNFDSIPWGSASHFLKVEMLYNDEIIEIGTSQFQFVPYSLYALHSEDNSTSLSINGNVLKLSNGSSVILPIDTTSQIQYLHETNDSLFLSKTANPNKIDISEQLSLTGNKLSIKRGNSVYLDSTNQLITSTSLSGDSIHIVQAGIDHPINVAAIASVPWVGFSVGATSEYNNFSTGTFTINFSNSNYDNTSSFFGSSFTAPQTGVYFFQLNLVFLETPNSLSILVNGTAIQTFVSATLATFSTNLMLPLKVSDKVSVQIINSTTYPLNLEFGTFSGYRIN